MGQLLDRRTALLAITATIVPVGTFSALAQGVDPGVKPDEARSLAQEAWVFGMPLVYIEKQIDTVTHVDEAARAARADQSICAIPRIPRRIE